MADLFANDGAEVSAPRPLADRLRPQDLAAIAGQDHLTGEGGVVRRMLESGSVPSCIPKARCWPPRATAGAS